jgi:serine/threonine-protein phosphatase 2B catalytic subunit
MELLGDPASDRKVAVVVPPPHRVLAPELFYLPGRELPNWRLLQGFLQKEGRVGKPELVALVQAAADLFHGEPNCLSVSDPITIVGDVHGQYYDLLKVLELGGCPETHKYLFLGDYVDRGSFSVEIIILLYAIKLNYPKTFLLLRGNHESRQMTSFFNFRQECLVKYDQEVYDLVMESFDRMPLCCVLNNNFFAVHGGISPGMASLSDLDKVYRRAEPAKEGLICDLLWADPCEKDGPFAHGFSKNAVRGCSYFYNNEAVKHFLDRNKLLSLIRAHEAQVEGFKFHWPKSKGLPLAITIFSAPNYCDCYNNKGAIINFKNNIINVKQFNYSPHPFLLPNFMNLLDWSLPFVAEKVGQIFMHLLKPIHECDPKEELDMEKGKRLRNKVMAISKILALQKKLKS